MKKKSNLDRIKKIWSSLEMCYFLYLLLLMKTSIKQPLLNIKTKKSYFIILNIVFRDLKQNLRGFYQKRCI